MLNQPRTIPYDFRVFSTDGTVWLVDWSVWLVDSSERTYPCTSTPHVHCEALYPIEGCREELTPDGLWLFMERDIPETHKVPVSISAETSEREAWDEAREEAVSNHII